MKEIESIRAARRAADAGFLRRPDRQRQPEDHDQCADGDRGQDEHAESRGYAMNQAPIIEFDLDIAKDIADQCICHPVSRSVDDIERAGEAIKYLLWVIEKTRATAAVELDRAQRGEPVAWIWRFSDGELHKTPFGTLAECERDAIGYDGSAVPLYTAPQPERKPMMDQTAHDMNLVAEKYAHKLALEIGKAMP